MFQRLNAINLLAEICSMTTLVSLNMVNILNHRICGMLVS